MKKSTTLLILALTCASPHLLAGVVLEMITRDASGTQTETSTISAESGKVRLDNLGGNSSSEMTMIFRDEQMLMLNHQEKTYVVMDETMFDQINAQMSDAMKQMEAQLANVPPEQRAMMEEMMKGHMETLAPVQQPVAPALRIEAIGSGDWDSYSCTLYAVHEENEKVQEICAASLDQIEGAGEVVGAFRKMAEFMNKLMASVPGDSAAGMAGNPTQMMDRIDGFPVHTLHFVNGQLRQEDSLKSATAQELEPGLFSPPGGYKRQELMQQR
jgi:hypothetical protein